jgi:hypothetical protein
MRRRVGSGVLADFAPRGTLRYALVVLFAASAGAGLANGCSAVGNNGTTITTGAGGDAGMESSSTGKTTSTASSGGGGAGGQMIIMFPDAGGDAADASDGDGSVPCGSKCGTVELCDPAHLGYDDNCNGEVDEGCPCTQGQTHWCFAGDPMYRNTPGCFDGTEYCTELGMWGPCMGGVQAVGPNPCYENDTTMCHAIAATPYATVDLSTGLGQFGANATSGVYSVTCPNGVSQCPTVMGASSYSPQQSGEYMVTYTKMVAGGSGPVSCTYPLFVGAPGLRIELSWEHHLTDMGVDLDLHVHQPVNTGPWGISPPVEQDCTWSNCVISDFSPPQGFDSPRWFADPPAMPPTPVNWYDAPMMANNTCYDDPRGVGQEWQQLGMGCHNPRLDADNITCDYSITDPQDPDFCAPENINIDYPPTGQWIRVGVHYYNNHGLSYDVHPEIKIFCNGALAGDLGPNGYYMPQSPVTFEAADGEGIGGNRFWIVADVGFASDGCGATTCTVQPIYSDATQQTPFFTIDNAAVSAFAPAYPPPP